MRRSYLWALLIALAVIGWMASGQFSSEPETAIAEQRLLLQIQMRMSLKKSPSMCGE